MSNYERNNTMIACIFTVIVVGAIAVGAFAWFATSHWNFPGGNWQATTEFSFERESSSMPELTTVNISVNAGAVRVVFVDDIDLQYRIDIEVPNQTILDYGTPTVTYSSDIVSLDYQVAAVNVTLGTGSNYTLNLEVSTGGCEIVLDEYAHIGDIAVEATTGGIDLSLSDDVTLYGADVDITLQTTTGGIKTNIDLPTGIGGKFTGSTSLGEVDITANGWDEVSTNSYETSDYDSATQTVTVSATATTGGVDATLS